MLFGLYGYGVGGRGLIYRAASKRQAGGQTHPPPPERPQAYKEQINTRAGGWFVPPYPDRDRSPNFAAIDRPDATARTIRRLQGLRISPKLFDI
jgi:hypothetical protein